MKNYIQELKWRGMLHDVMPGTEEIMQKEMITGYAGFDPTADSLHIGNLVPIMMLKFLQLSGHKPIALVGGATGMVGDPSGREDERKLLDLDRMNHNLECQKRQLQKFLDFSGTNAAELVNNYDWFKDFSFLGFIRDVGKHITVSYMMGKDSVQNRLEKGISFTEFSYQLVQGYDFYHLYKTKNCRLQVGGSDQWGNIVTGTELIRRMAAGEAYAATCPLITRSDGKKFGKSEGANFWLDGSKTSPYRFYQYWINCSDEDAARYLKIFTLLEQEEIEALVALHRQAPHERALQKRLAQEITEMVHDAEAVKKAEESSQILFGKSTTEQLQQLNEEDILDIFDGVPVFTIPLAQIEQGPAMIDFLAVHTQILASKGEARRSLQENAISINKQKVKEDRQLSKDDLINGKYLIVQKGKKDYFLVKSV